MTDQEMRIAIAEACGWRDCRPATSIGRELGKTVIATNDREQARAASRRDRGFPFWPYTEIPDYLNDLNAMHEAEKVLKEGDALRCIDYVNELQLIEPGVVKSRYGLVHATARQRAEAFLRTIGKWKD